MQTDEIHLPPPMLLPKKNHGNDDDNKSTTTSFSSFEETIVATMIQACCHGPAFLLADNSQWHCFYQVCDCAAAPWQTEVTFSTESSLASL
jgi:hypothetical protein